jgi:hypothetical protein
MKRQPCGTGGSHLVALTPLLLRRCARRNAAPALPSLVHRRRITLPTPQFRVPALPRPSWIVLGDATDALDPASADTMLWLIVDLLPQAGIVLIGRHPGSADIFTQRRPSSVRPMARSCSMRSMRGARRRSCRAPGRSA